mmetsp:Transcript_94392/g.266576  ORF Transcript_94392/g.266576 Transcript_94392/m.266576 type:complete len:280 (+) Transcript_94392:451-1290(+)
MRRARHLLRDCAWAASTACDLDHCNATRAADAGQRKVVPLRLAFVRVMRRKLGENPELRRLREALTVLDAARNELLGDGNVGFDAPQLFSEAGLPRREVLRLPAELHVGMLQFLGGGSDLGIRVFYGVALPHLRLQACLVCGPLPHQLQNAPMLGLREPGLEHVHLCGHFLDGLVVSVEDILFCWHGEAPMLVAAPAGFPHSGRNATAVLPRGGDLQQRQGPGGRRPVVTPQPPREAAQGAGSFRELVVRRPQVLHSDAEVLMELAFVGPRGVQLRLLF